MALPVQAHVVFFGEAALAVAAADPGEDDADIADGDAMGFGVERRVLV